MMSIIPRCSTIFISILVVLFVVGSWLNLSGIWIEFPLIVDQLPEGWGLPATMGLIANLANIGVVIIAVVRRFSYGRVTYEIPANIFILTTGTVVLIILAFVWDKTTLINGTRHSTYLMGFSLSLSLVDCTSSVTFLPFLDRYEPVYINAYFFGEALSSLFPALLGIAQGVGETSCVKNPNGTLVEYNSPPRFSVRTYFLALAVIMLASLLSFIALCLTRMGRRKGKTSIDAVNNKFAFIYFRYYLKIDLF
jgi:riboflavin transporter 2